MLRRIPVGAQAIIQKSDILIVSMILNPLNPAAMKTSLALLILKLLRKHMNFGHPEMSLGVKDWTTHDI